MPDRRPVRRIEELDVRELPNNEMLVYDRQQRVTHHLASETALIWERCDGNNNRSDLERIVGSEFNISEPTTTVDKAIERLDQLRLIQF
jgi:hypothetical protein